MRKILLLGNGGHAKSCLDLIENSKVFQLSGIISQNKNDVGKNFLDIKF